MKPVLWVLQTNLNSEASEDKLQRFLAQRGTAVREFRIVPMDDSPLDVEWDGPVVFYGSTSLMRRVMAENRWKPGVFMDLEASSFHILKERYGKELLNYHSKVMTLEDFLGHPWVDDLAWFVRPVHDTKAIVGAVRNFREWKDRLSGSVGARGGPTPDTLIQVAHPREIANEWRVCVLEGKAITASSYRVEGKSELGGPIPPSVLKYAETMAAVYSPQPVFMLDVAEIKGPKYKVIEVNCFNCSGFYWMDVYEIARHVTDFVERKYG